MPRSDFEEIVAEHFPECDVFSFKEVARAAPYNDWRSFDRAVTKAQSAVHFVKDGPIRATTVTSAYPGIENLKTATEKSLEEGQKKGYLNRWTDVS